MQPLTSERGNNLPASLNDVVERIIRNHAQQFATRLPVAAGAQDLHAHPSGSLPMASYSPRPRFGGRGEQDRRPSLPKDGGEGGRTRPSAAGHSIVIFSRRSVTLRVALRVSSTCLAFSATQR